MTSSERLARGFSGHGYRARCPRCLTRIRAMSAGDLAQALRAHMVANHGR